MVLRIQAHEFGARNRRGNAAPLVEGRCIIVTAMQDEGGGGYFRQQIDDVDFMSGDPILDSVFQRCGEP